MAQITEARNEIISVRISAELNAKLAEESRNRKSKNIRLSSKSDIVTIALIKFFKELERQ